MYTYIYIYIFWTVSFTGVLFYISVPRPYNVSACRHSASSRHLRCVIAPNTHSTCSTACHQEAALVCKHAEKSTNQRLETQPKGLVCKNTDHRMLFFSFFINASQMCTHLPYFMNSHFFWKHKCHRWLLKWIQDLLQDFATVPNNSSSIVPTLYVSSKINRLSHLDSLSVGFWWPSQLSYTLSSLSRRDGHIL